MKNFVQYHNAFKQGPINPDPQGRFEIFAKKPLRHLLGHRVWLISGHGKASPKQYQLEYTYVVDEIVPGTPNRAIGRIGHRFPASTVLNHQPWFPAFLKRQANFSLGASVIPDEFLQELDALSSNITAHAAV